MKKALLLPRTLKPVTRSALPLRARIAGAFALVGLTAGLGMFASRPAHTASGPIAVTVANSPLAVTLTDAAAPKQPFNGGTVYRFSGADTFAAVDTGDGFAPIQVPAGKRLIVQTVAATADGGGNERRFQASIAGVAGGVVKYYPLPIVSDFGIPFAGTTQAIAISVDPGEAIRFSLVRADPATTQYVSVAVFGYLVDAP